MNLNPKRLNIPLPLQLYPSNRTSAQRIQTWLYFLVTYSGVTRVMLELSLGGGRREREKGRERERGSEVLNRLKDSRWHAITKCSEHENRIPNSVENRNVFWFREVTRTVLSYFRERIEEESVERYPKKNRNQNGILYRIGRIEMRNWNHGNENRLE